MTLKQFFDNLLLIFVLIFSSVFLFSKCSAAAVKAQDTFTEASNTNLESHVPDTGTAWQTSTAAKLVVNAANDNLTSDGTNNRRYGVETTTIGDDDMDVSATVTVVDTNLRRAGVTGRATTANYSNQYEAYADGNSTVSSADILLDKVVSTTRTNLGSYNLSPGGSVTLKLEIRTGTKVVFVDGVSRISSTDDNLTGNNFAGVVMQQDANTLDNFLSESVAAVSNARRPVVVLTALLARLVPNVYAQEDGRIAKFYVDDVCGDGTDENAFRPCLVLSQGISNWVLEGQIAGKMYFKVLETPEGHSKLALTGTQITAEKFPVELKKQIARRGYSKIDGR